MSDRGYRGGSGVGGGDGGGAIVLFLVKIQTPGHGLSFGVFSGMDEGGS